MKSFNAKRRFRSAIHAVQVTRFLGKLSHHDDPHHLEDGATVETFLAAASTAAALSSSSSSSAAAAPDEIGLSNNILTRVVSASGNHPSPLKS
jgi:hypothetical protein